MAQTEPQFRQAETVQLAPDALVFINGSDKIRDDNNEVYEIRNDITDINVSLSIDSPPGTAGFTISLPDHSIRRTADTRYSAIKMMSEIEIYFKGRFPKEQTDGTLQYPYYPAFWGIIISIIENYSDGVNTISVSCADILRWWQITTVNVNASIAAAFKKTLDEQEMKDQDSVMKGEAKSETNARGNKMSIFGNKFADNELNIAEILIELSKIAEDELVPINEQLDAAFGATDKINAEQREAARKDLMSYWRTRFNQVGRSLRIFGIESTRIGPSGRFEIKFKDENFLEVVPYKKDAQQVSSFDSTLKSKLEIANELKDSIQFEFFMDVTGEIIFKPPFYNMNVITNQSSVMRDLDIISWNFNQAEAEVITRFDVTGDFSMVQSTGSDASKRTIKGIWIDYELARRYGFRSGQRTIGWVTDKNTCLQYAQAEMAKMNARARQGSITIMGRPELRLGYPIYIPSRDAFYYVKAIDHSFSFGGSFTTTLTLIAERRYKKDENGDPIKWGLFRNVGEVKDETVTKSGSSLIDNNEEFDNFVKQMTDACTPSKGSNPQVNEANFKDNLDHIASVKMGDWNSFRNIKLSNTADLTSEYQTSDGDGYELVIPFKYGMDMKFTDTSETEFTGSDDAQTNIKNDADKAKNLNPNDFRLIVNPNNSSLTLDPEFADASMLYLYDRTARTSAEKALQVTGGNDT